jgi:ATP-dependent exoDNAse (exonuclease V) alpha subunit
VEGTTVNSWGGFGLGEHDLDFDRMMEHINMEKNRNADALLIDEMSMLNKFLFDILESMVSIM